MEIADGDFESSKRGRRIHRTWVSPGCVGSIILALVIAFGLLFFFTFSRSCGTSSESDRHAPGQTSSKLILNVLVSGVDVHGMFSKGMVDSANKLARKKHDGGGGDERMHGLLASPQPTVLGRVHTTLFPNWARSIATSSRPVARVHTGATGTLVPDPRDHLSTWNEWARSITIGRDRSRPVESVVWTLEWALGSARQITRCYHTPH